MHGGMKPPEKNGPRPRWGRCGRTPHPACLRRPPPLAGGLVAGPRPLPCQCFGPGICVSGLLFSFSFAHFENMCFALRFFFCFCTFST
jgi:hypothetical protein